MNTKKTIAFISTSGLAAGIAQSQVIYSGQLNLTQFSYTPASRQQVDMTADGTPDFAFGFEGGDAQKPYVDARTLVGADAPIPQSGIVSLLAYASHGLPVTSSGMMIDASYAATFPALPAGRAYFYEDGDTGSVTGDWSNTSTTDGYVGIELSLAGGNSYGWLHFIDDPSAQSLTLVDWAYQSTPDTGIQTGPVPEPTTLALGGLGMATLLMFRKRK